MKRLLKYLNEYKKDCFIGSSFKLIEVIFELIVPLVVAKIINTGIGNNDRTYIWHMAAVLVLLGLAGMLFSITAQYFSANAATGFAAKIRAQIFKKVEALSFSNLDKLGTSAILTRITSDINQLQNGVNLALRLLLRSPFIVFGAMIMAFTVDTKSALIFTVVIPILFAVVFTLMISGIYLYKKVQSKLDILTNDFRENLKGIRVLRAFRKEETEKKLFDLNDTDFEKWQLFSGRIMSAMNPLTLLIVNLGIIFLIRAGAFSVNSGRINQGDIIALINYMSQILVELLKFANLIITLSKSFAGASRIADFLELENDPGNVPEKTEEDAKPSYIDLRNVSFSYQSTDTNVLSDINLSIEKGDRIGIIGGTGSGKTTLVNLICGFYRPTEGCIYYKGRRLFEYSKDELMRDIAIVMQKSVLFSGTIESNIRWGNENASKEDMIEALNHAQADFAIEKGLDAVVEQEGKNFSGGQRQRLSIARALIKNADILILDDSSSALDYMTEAKLNRSIEKARQGKTTITISQRVSSIIHSDKIVVLEDGVIAGVGRHAELLDSCEVYNEIYYAQFPLNGGASDER